MVDNNKKINRVYVVFFYFSYILLLFVDMISSTKFVSLIKPYVIFLILVMLIVDIIIVFSKISRKSIFKILICVLITLLCFYFTKIKEPFFILLFIIAARYINLNKFFKNDIIIRTLMIISIVLLFLIGLLPNVILISPGGIIRNSFGFSHPNTLGFNSFILILEILFTNYNKKMNIVSILYLIVLLLISYFACYSRTAVIMSVFAIIIFLIFKQKKNLKIKNNFFTKYILPNTYLILFLFTLILIVLYNHHNQIAIFIDKLLSYRINFASFNLKYFDISLFGNELVNSESHNIIWQVSSGVDNVYIFSLIHYGLLCVLMYIILFYSLIRKSVKKSYIRVILCFICILLYGMSEKYILRVSFNPFILFAILSFFDEVKYVEK